MCFLTKHFICYFIIPQNLYVSPCGRDVCLHPHLVPEKLSVCSPYCTMVRLNVPSSITTRWGIVNATPRCNINHFSPCYDWFVDFCWRLKSWLFNTKFLTDVHTPIPWPKHVCINKHTHICIWTLNHTHIYTDTPIHLIILSLTHTHTQAHTHKPRLTDTYKHTITLTHI